jgi:hypothetical protein
MRYALALGLGRDPTDAAQLKFVNDTATGMPLALPTLAVVLGFPGSWMQDPATGIDFAQIVHGEERSGVAPAIARGGHGGGAPPRDARRRQGAGPRRHRHLRQGAVRRRERRSAGHGDAHDLRARQRRLRDRGRAG